MKKIISLLLAALMLFSCAMLMAGCGSSDGKGTLTLNVYNWGEYISDGSEGSLNTIKAFESWYEETYGQKVKVNYSTYASNEDMYAKLQRRCELRRHHPLRLYDRAHDRRGYAAASEF